MNRQELFRRYIDRNYPVLVGYARKKITGRLALAGRLVWAEDPSGCLVCRVTDGSYVSVSSWDIEDYCHNVLTRAWAQLVRENPNGPLARCVFGAVRQSIGKYRSTFSGRGTQRSVRANPLAYDVGRESLSQVECKELALLLPTMLEGRAKRIAGMLVWAYLNETSPPRLDDIAQRLRVSKSTVSTEICMVRSCFDFLLFVS